MTTKVVVILTQWIDPTADRVVEELNEREIPVFRFDSAEFPQHLTVSAVLREKGWTSTLKTARRELDVGSVAGIYYRRPTSFDFPPGMPAADRHWARAEARMALGGILSSLSCWLNHPSRIAAAEFKPFQLDAAVRVGLRVPRTIVTNDPSAAGRFAESVGRIIYKPLACSFLDDKNGEHLPIYASLAEREILTDPSISLTAHLFQEWIEHEYAVRLTVVDRKFFACAIRAGSDAAYVDWRSDYAALTYSIVTCPPWIERGVTALMEKLGLRFGALDFLVTPAHEWVFLEINPNGQWAWIEEETGLAITVAIADSLTGRSTW